MNVRAALVLMLGLLGWLTLFESGKDFAKMIGDKIMEFSDNGIDAIKRFEGFSPVPYPDAQGFSIGYGHFILPGENLTKIDRAQAETLLRQDARTASDAVNQFVGVPLTQNQFDALVSFAYNVGVTAFKKSTLLRELNAGNYTSAAAQFARWNKSQGATLAALTQRRAAEARLFLTA